MDAQTLGQFGGWIGGILGAVIGILGGAFGTYMSIRNTRGPRERAFTIKAAIVCWILVLGFVAAMLLIPTWHKHLLWIPYAFALVLGIRIANRTHARIRREESGAPVRA